jgi:Na+-translocating ferredoxin:NAD+ oxidoreductase RnfD subunit
MSQNMYVLTLLLNLVIPTTTSYFSEVTGEILRVGIDKNSYIAPTLSKL